MQNLHSAQICFLSEVEGKTKMVVDSPVKVPVSNSRLSHADDAANGNGKEDDGDSSGGEEIENVHR